MENNNNDGNADNSGSNEIITINESTPTKVKVIERTNQIIKYLQAKGPAAKLYAAPPNGELIYEIFLESRGLFLKAGSYSFQLTAKPMKAWQGDLRLTAGSIRMLENAERMAAEAARITPVDEIRKSFFRSFIETSENPSAEKQPKKIDIFSHPQIKQIFENLKEELKNYRGLKGKNFTISDKIFTRTFVMICENNRNAGSLTDRLVRTVKTVGKLDEEVYSARGGSFEELAVKLGEITKCSTEVIRALKMAPPQSRILIKHYSSGSNLYDFNPYTVAVVITKDIK